MNKLYQAQSVAVLNGISEVIDSVRKNIPGMNSSLTDAINKCSAAIHSNESSILYYELSSIAKILNTELSNEFSGDESSFLELMSKLNLFENQLLSKKEQDMLLLIHRKVKGKEISVKEGMAEVGNIIVSIADNSKALSNTSFGNKAIKQSIYAEGTEKVLQADLAVSTRRLGRDLESLSLMLLQGNPGDPDIVSVRERVLKLNVSDSTKFFEAMDILSTLTWVIFRINSNRIHQERKDLTSLAISFKSFASGMKKSDNLNKEISLSLTSFESDFESQILEIQNSGNNAKTLSELKAKMIDSIEKIKNRTLDFASKQQKLIFEQKKVIEQQASALASSVSKLNSANKQINEIKSESNTDSLSGIGNRKSYDEKISKLQREWVSSIGKKKIGLVLIDIDWFKKINDQFGHQVGDEVISWIGKILITVQNKYPGVLSYRYGGEEFALISDGYSPDDVMKITKWIHKFFQEKSFISSNGIHVNITASIGVAFFVDKSDNHQSVFFHADKALYKAKDSGRNQIWIGRIKEIKKKFGENSLSNIKKR